MTRSDHLRELAARLLRIADEIDAAGKSDFGTIMQAAAGKRVPVKVQAHAAGVSERTIFRRRAKQRAGVTLCHETSSTPAGPTGASSR
jgi:hypothetical protein